MDSNHLLCAAFYSLLISWLILLSVSLFRHYIKKKTIKKKIGGKTYIAFQDTKDKLILSSSGVVFTEDLMIDIVNEIGNNYDVIIFLKSAKIWSKEYCRYRCGDLIFKSNNKRIDIVSRLSNKPISKR